MNILEDIKRHEGFRSKVYKCTEGYDTIGYGFAIKDLEIDKDVAELILMKKIKKLLEGIISTFDWFENSPEEVKFAVTNMCYQLGLAGFSKFKKTIYYLETEQYQEAAIECLDSLWARQTPNRAQEISEAFSSASSD